jgi:hypothetical protein
VRVNLEEAMRLITSDKGRLHLFLAQLPQHASIFLAKGVSPAYVQEQLGHATIELTVRLMTDGCKSRT